MEYRIISSLNNKSILLNSQKMDPNTKSPQIMYKSTAFDSPEYKNTSRSEFRHVQKQYQNNLYHKQFNKIQNTSLCAELSRYHDHILQSQQIFLSNKCSPNPEKKNSSPKESKMYRSKTYQDQKQHQTLTLSSKMQTDLDRKQSQYSTALTKKNKSVHLNANPQQIFAPHSKKPFSKVTSIKYKSKNDSFSRTHSLERQFLNDKIAKAQNEEFYKKLSKIINKNQEINVRYRQVETEYDRLNEDLKSGLQSELSEIQNMRHTINRQFNQRKVKINSRIKTNLTKNISTNQSYLLKQSQMSTLNKQTSQIVK